MWSHFKPFDHDQGPNSCKFIPLNIEAQIMGLDLSQKSIMWYYAIFSYDKLHWMHFIEKSYIVLVHMANSFCIAISRLTYDWSTLSLWDASNHIISNTSYYFFFEKSFINFLLYQTKNLPWSILICYFLLPFISYIN